MRLQPYVVEAATLCFQVAFADRLLLNKIDLVPDEAALLHVEARYLVITPMTWCPTRPRCCTSRRDYAHYDLTTSYFLLTAYMPPTSYFLRPTSYVLRPTSYLPLLYLLLPTYHSYTSCFLLRRGCAGSTSTRPSCAVATRR
eukprot:scaffold105728_cov40-Phaeocystis_antarctica.AAC.2